MRYLFPIANRITFFLLIICLLSSRDNFLAKKRKKEQVSHQEITTKPNLPHQNSKNIKKDMEETDNKIWLNDIQFNPRKKKKEIKTEVMEAPNRIGYLKIRAMDGILRTINFFKTENKKIYTISGGVVVFLIMTFIFNGIYPGKTNVNKLIEKHCILSN